MLNSKNFARKILARLAGTNVKGEKTQTKAALDMIVGAAAAIELLGQQTGTPYDVEVGQLSMIAYMVSIRGIGFVEEMSK